MNCMIANEVSKTPTQSAAPDAVSPDISSTSAGNVMFSLIGFLIFYSSLLVVDLFLLGKYIRLGPAKTLGHAIALPGVRVTALEAPHVGL